MHDGIDGLLRQAVELGASDVHLSVGKPPAVRLNGHLQQFGKDDKLLPADTDAMAQELLSEEQWKGFMQNGDLDLAYSIGGVGRFRVNIFRQRNSTGLVLRLINSKIPPLEALGLPPILQELTTKPRGLILVTGPTGSGKSTTLAAMINVINETRNDHIITLEDPVEYIHHHKKSVVNQREIGADCESFAKGLRAALRQDPDVILVGEMRDLETISIAITAAETGHLVFGTLHTSSAAQTVDRIMDVFPPYQQQQVKVQLAETLQGIIAQQLIPRDDKQGRVAAVEILVATPAVRNLIREGKTHQLVSSIQTGGKFGMQSMDNSLRNLFQKGFINREEVLSRGHDTASLGQMV